MVIIIITHSIYENQLLLRIQLGGESNDAVVIKREKIFYEI